MKIKKTVISSFGESSSSFRPGVEHFANHPFFLDALYDGSTDSPRGAPSIFQYIAQQTLHPKLDQLQY